MSGELTEADTDKLLALQEECDRCKEAIVHESDVEMQLEMQKMCEVCKRVRLRVPELMEVKRKLQAANAERNANV